MNEKPGQDEVHEIEIVNRKPKSGNPIAIGAVGVIIVAFLWFVVYPASKTTSMQAALDEAKATATKIEVENNELRAKVAKLEASARASVITPDAVCATSGGIFVGGKCITKEAVTEPKIRGMFGVVIGTLYRLDQRKLFKEETAAALDTCSDDTLKLELILVETGDIKHVRHETKAVAAAKGGMTEKQAQAKATCLHENLPPVVTRGKDGRPMMVKVITETVDGSKGSFAKAPVVQAEE